MRQSSSDFRLCQAELGGNAHYCNFLDADLWGPDRKLVSHRFPVERTELGNQVEVPWVFRLNGEAVAGD
jgi:hypothetical protein